MYYTTCTTTKPLESCNIPEQIWWIAHIPNHITTVIEYGCGIGVTNTILKKFYPNRFKYIGITEEADKIKAAQFIHSDAEFFSTIEEFKKAYGTPLDSVFVMNFSISELYSKVGNCEARIFLRKIIDMGFDYIAIRDMKLDRTREHRYFKVPLIERVKLEWQIKKSGYLKSFKEYKEYPHHPRKSLAFYEEFFLKYFYLREDWEEYLEKRFLWDWTPYLKYDIGNSYISVFAESYCSSYVKDRVKKDFNYDMFHTHVKLLLRKE